MSTKINSEARNMLTHAALWLTASNMDAPAWAQAGVYFAIRKIDNAKATFFGNRHTATRCQRCAEICGVVQFAKEAK